MQNFRVNTAEAEQLVMALHKSVDSNWKMLVEREEHTITDDYDLLDKANRLSLYRKLRAMEGEDYRTKLGADTPLNKVQIQRWHPDTCSCILTFLWNSDHPEDGREHHPHRSETHCPAHRDLVPHSHAHHGEVLAENQHKNHSTAALAEHLGVPPSEVKYRHQYHGTHRMLILRHPFLNNKLRHGNATVHLSEHPEASKRPLKLER